VSTDHELIALATCNILNPIFGGLTAFVSYSRTNIQCMIGVKN